MIRLVGLQKIRDDIAGIRARITDLGPAYLRAAMVALAAAQYRIRDKNEGSWPPTLETSRGTSLNRTGALMRSLTIGGAGNLYTEIDGGIRVGTNLRTPDGGYSVGALMQYGTGPIRPTSGKFLVFELNGQKIFSKGTKGIPARPFLYIGEQDAVKIQAVFAEHIVGGDHGGA